LDSANVAIDLVLYLSISEEEIVNRMSGRRVHPASGRSYHILYNPPKVDGFDDVTQEPLIQREDDAPEVIKKRLDVYYDETEPLLDFYRNKNLQFIEIDAAQSLDKVTKSIRESIAN
jgi:adenylate kinase